MKSIDISLIKNKSKLSSTKCISLFSTQPNSEEFFNSLLPSDTISLTVTVISCIAIFDSNDVECTVPSCTVIQCTVIQCTIIQMQWTVIQCTVIQIQCTVIQYTIVQIQCMVITYDTRMFSSVLTSLGVRDLLTSLPSFSSLSRLVEYSN